MLGSKLIYVCKWPGTGAYFTEVTTKLNELEFSDGIKTCVNVLNKRVIWCLSEAKVHRWFSTRLRLLQCVSNGVNAVLHKASICGTALRRRFIGLNIYFIYLFLLGIFLCFSSLYYHIFIGVYSLINRFYTINSFINMFIRSLFIYTYIYLYVVQPHYISHYYTPIAIKPILSHLCCHICDLMHQLFNCYTPSQINLSKSMSSYRFMTHCWPTTCMIISKYITFNLTHVYLFGS